MGECEALGWEWGLQLGWEFARDYLFFCDTSAVFMVEQEYASVRHHFTQGMLCGTLQYMIG